MIDQAEGLRTLVRQSSDRTRLRSIVTEEKISNNTKTCTTIAVTSGKGGVGKTNISINLALSLAKLKKKVILFDADLGLANVNILMGINPKSTLLDVVEGRVKLEDILIKAPGNIYIVPGGSGMEELANLDSIAMMQLIRSLEKLEKSCDYLIFDTMAGISTMVKAFAKSADIQLVVATPEPSSFADAYAAIKMMTNAGCDSINLVVNQILTENEGRETFNKMNMLTKKFMNRDINFLGAIPSDRNVGLSVRKQSPILLSSPNLPFARSIGRIALVLLGKKPLGSNQGFFKKFIGYFLKEGNK